MGGSLSDLVERLLKVCDDVFDVLQTDRNTHHARLDACGNKLLVGQLAMGLGSRMQHAGSDVGNVNLVARQLQAVHELHRRSAAALDVDGHDARGAQRQILLRALEVLVARQGGVANGGDLVAGLKEFCDGQRVLAVLAHTTGRVSRPRLSRNAECAEGSSRSHASAAYAP